MEYACLPHQALGPPDRHHAPPPPTPVSQRTRGSSLLRQQRRLALEQEVAELKQQLSNEETVHHILERALQPSISAGGRSINIPAFIPGKVKELLAELVLVEEEIARLENQIKQMKQRSPTVTTSSSGNYAIQTSSAPPAAAANTTAASSHGNGMEMKSMFFITQAMAMDGDYLKRHLVDDKDSRRQMSPTTKNSALPPRHSSHQLPGPAGNNNSSKNNKASRHELPIITTESCCSPTTTVKHQPNKLSERILKCLVCIFIRLLRSSRAAELEKDRSAAGNGAGGSFSFRIDTGLNVASSKEKADRGQQDHYGIFGIQDAIVRDVGPYKNLVRFTSGSFDLRGFSSSPLLTKLRGMLEALQQVDLRFLNHQQKLAFWLNIYNTCIMHGILQHGLPSNSEKLLALKNKATINVSGRMFNALVIENFILRQPSSVKEEFWKCDVDVEEQEVRGLYGLTSSEPNTLFALCCGIRSSPALRIYKADRVLVDLEKAKLEYLQASLVVTSTRRLLIPSLIHSNMHDFAKDMDSLVRWICEQLPTSWSLRKSMVDCCLRRGGGGGGGGGQQQNNVVDVIPFDYEFQYLLPMM